MSKSELKKMGTARFLGDTAEREIGLSGRPNCRKGNEFGQAMVEYILLIGLLSVILLGVLIGFRDSVLGFTQAVVAFFQTAPGPPVTAVVSPPPIVRPAPVARPTPRPTPVPEEDPASRLEGYWCNQFNHVHFAPVGPGLISITRIYPDGRRQNVGTYRVTSLNAGEVRSTGTGANSAFYENLEFLNPNTFRINGGSHGRFAAPGDNFVRCNL